MLLTFFDQFLASPNFELLSFRVKHLSTIGLMAGIESVISVAPTSETSTQSNLR